MFCGVRLPVDGVFQVESSDWGSPKSTGSSCLGRTALLHWWVCVRVWACESSLPLERFQQQQIPSSSNTVRKMSVFLALWGRHDPWDCNAQSCWDLRRGFCSRGGRRKPGNSLNLESLTCCCYNPPDFPVFLGVIAQKKAFGISHNVCMTWRLEGYSGISGCRLSCTLLKICFKAVKLGHVKFFETWTCFSLRVCHCVFSVSDRLLAGAPLSASGYSHHHGIPGETACPGQRWTRTHAPPKRPDFNEQRALIST